MQRSPAHGKALAAWWAVRTHLIHEHHDNEEIVFIPWMQTKVAVPQKVSADHKLLIASMDEISAIVKKLESQDEGARIAALDTLRDKQWPAFASLFLEHIREEEVVLTPLMQANFSFNEYQTMVAAIVKRAMKDGPVELPWMITGMPAADRAAFTGELPWVPRMLLKHVWEPKYLRTTAQLLVPILGPLLDVPVPAGCCA